ncbi:MAG: ABC transporter ATP-binding protein, partial [Candidatus Rokuibacteriota bacterium]
MLAVEELVVAYGRIQALRGVSLTVGRGEYVGVIGPNGAGKTTLLLALSGALPVAAGRIVLDGEDLARVPPHARVSRGVAIVPEGREVFGPLSVRENLELGAYHRRRTAPRAEVRADLEMVLDLFPVLRGRSRQLAATLSGGEQQMLAVGRAL